MTVLTPAAPAFPGGFEVAGTEGERRRTRIQWLVILAPVVLILIAGWQLRWMSDDGFIHLRVVEQLVGGNGPVFNAGERVEASTSPLWVGLLALAYPVTSLALPWKAVVLGIALCAAGLLAAQRAAVWLAGRDTGGVVVPIGAVVIACLPPFWEFASSGLETGLAFAWLGAACWWCARCTATSPSARSELAGAVLVGLGPLIRPDLGLFTLAFAAVLLAARWRQGIGPRVQLVAALAALPMAFQVFRMGYYAMVVPNTAVAKEAGESNWRQGTQYLADLVVPYWLWVPGLLLAVVLAAQVRRDLGAGERLRAATGLAPVLAAALHVLYLTRLGGDFMHARLLLPAVFAAAAPVGLRVTGGIWRPAIATAMAVWALVCAVSLHPNLSSEAPWGGLWPVSDDGTIAEEREFYRSIRRLEVPVRLDLSIAKQLRQDPRSWPQAGLVYLGESNEPEYERLPIRPELDAVAAQASMSVGAAGVAWGDDVRVIDILSLAHPVGSHLDHQVGNRPGHQKPVPLAWRAAGVVQGTEVRTVDGTVVLTSAELRAAERALGCGQLGRYLRGITRPLTVSRFLGNVLQSVANTTFRVPPEPGDAEARLC